MLQNELLLRYRKKFSTYLSSKFPEHYILHQEILERKPQITQATCLSASTIRVEEFSFQFDAIHCFLNPAHPRTVCCAPMLIIPQEKVTKSHKLLMAVGCILLAHIPLISVESGVLIYGQHLKTTTIRLKDYRKEAREIVKALPALLGEADTPRFFMQRACAACALHPNCKTVLLEKEDLSLLGNMKPTEVLRWNNRGFFTITQLSYQFRPSKRKHPSNKPRRFDATLKALALHEHKTYLLEIPQFSSTTADVYLDFEGVPDEKFIYLIGALVVTRTTTQHHAFWANSPDEEPGIFQQLFALLNPLQDVTIYHYGSYEPRQLKNFAKRWGQRYEEQTASVLERSINVLAFFTSAVYPPTYTNGLKEIAHFLQFQWSAPQASGLQSLVWRKRWELSAHDTYKETLIQYNREDCLALHVVKDWLVRIASDAQKNECHTDVMSVFSMPPEGPFKYGKGTYADETLKKIIKSAYFDYQREKIYLKTSKAVKQAVKRQKKTQQRAESANAIIDAPVPSLCPACQHHTLWVEHRNQKILIDIRFLKDGVKKWVTLMKYIGYSCARCHKQFTPEAVKFLPTYGRNLVIWVMNQHIRHRVSFNQISEMTKETFHISLNTQTAFAFKEKLALEYTQTYEDIQHALITGSLLHVDETQVVIKGHTSTAYVWVFATLSSVFYMFRPNREAEFLKDLLRGFTGVLVSDYYGGYDSLPCLQQKCLIHLVRDLNDDRFKHQMDTELRALVKAFGHLLEVILDTAHAYGLKAYHLRKHKTDVHRFYRTFVEKDVESEVALKYQTRFRKYRNKLFTFLDYDGIPWNNNNAETAIKPFAEYRKHAGKKVTEKAIKEHLTLLSIQQTCKYRGLNFLEFLKSGEKSIDRYSSRH